MNQFLTRRSFILIPIMSILKIIFTPMKVLASSLNSKEEWNLSKEEWKSRLNPESYYIFDLKEKEANHILRNEKLLFFFHYLVGY